MHEERRCKFRAQGWSLHSQVEVSGQLLAEFWTKNGELYTWTPGRHPQDLEGSEWKDAVVRNAEADVRKELAGRGHDNLDRSRRIFDEVSRAWEQKKTKKIPRLTLEGRSLPKADKGEYTQRGSRLWHYTCLN